MNHFAVEQELAQRCKTTTFQLKKKKELSNGGEFVYPGGTEGFAVEDSSLAREIKDD